MDHTARLEAAWEAQEAYGMDVHRTDPAVLTETELAERADLEWAWFYRVRWAEMTG